jgi:NCS1 family nucleobase:cation symporter-1
MYNFHGMYRYSARYATNWRSVSLDTISVSEGGKHL